MMFEIILAYMEHNCNPRYTEALEGQSWFGNFKFVCKIKKSEGLSGEALESRPSSRKNNKNSRKSGCGDSTVRTMELRKSLLSILQPPCRLSRGQPGWGANPLNSKSVIYLCAVQWFLLSYCPGTEVLSVPCFVCIDFPWQQHPVILNKCSCLTLAMWLCICSSSPVIHESLESVCRIHPTVTCGKPARRQ